MASRRGRDTGARRFGLDILCRWHCWARLARLVDLQLLGTPAEQCPCFPCCPSNPTSLRYSSALQVPRRHHHSPHGHRGLLHPRQVQGALPLLQCMLVWETPGDSSSGAGGGGGCIAAVQCRAAVCPVCPASACLLFHSAQPQRSSLALMAWRCLLAPCRPRPTPTSATSPWLPPMRAPWTPCLPSCLAGERSHSCWLP